MNRTFPTLILFALLLFPGRALALCAGVMPGYWGTYSRERFEAALENKKPVFCLVYSSWDYESHRILLETVTHPSIWGLLESQTIPVLIDGGMRPDLVRQYGVTRFPTCLMLSSNGDLLGGVDGFQSIPALSGFLGRGLEKFKVWWSHPSPSPSAVPFKPGFSGPPVNAHEAAEGAFRGYWVALSETLNTEIDPLYGGLGQGRKKLHPRLIAYLTKPTSPANGLGKKMFLTAMQQLGGRMVPFAAFAEGRDWSGVAEEGSITGIAWMAGPMLELGPKGSESLFPVTPQGLMAAMQALQPAQSGCFTEAWESPRIRELLKHTQKIPASELFPKHEWCFAPILAQTIIGCIRAAQAQPEEAFWKDMAARGAGVLRTGFLSNDGVRHSLALSSEPVELTGLAIDNGWALVALARWAEFSGDAEARNSLQEVAEYSLRTLYDPNQMAFVLRNSVKGDRFAPNEAFLPFTGEEENGVMAEGFALAAKVTGEQRYRQVAETLLARFSNQEGSLDATVAFLEAGEALGFTAPTLPTDSTFKSTPRYVSLWIGVAWCLLLAGAGGMVILRASARKLRV